jgi:predicted outer membrane repeat protein
VQGNQTNGDGAGIYNSGAITLTQSNVTDNDSNNYGGGIWNNGNVTINTTDVSYNYAYHDGGGIYNTKTLTISRSSFINNQAQTGDGGGICNKNATSDDMSITNSTFTFNLVGNVGGAIANFGYGTLLYSTISNNDSNHGPGGVYNDGSNGAIFIVTKSIIAFQSSGPDCNEPLGSGEYNYESATTCGFTDLGDVQNVTSDQLQLQPLADNGGPTSTMALGSNSVAIDHIPQSECDISTDQRGLARPHGNGCDSGAYEYQPPLHIHITALNQNDARISWTPPGVNQHFDVYRSDWPIWPTYDLSDYTPVGTVTSSPWQWDDYGALGDADTNHYYVVQGDPATHFSNCVAEFDFALTPGTP